MNNLSLKMLGIIFYFSLTSSVYAQDWQLGGNNFPPLNATNNILGTNINVSLRVHTNSIERFKIMQGGTGSAAGRIAMGNNLLAGFVPQARLHLHQTNAVNTIRFTTDNMTGGNGFEVGYNATSNVQNQQFAEIHNRENTAIKFFTTGKYPTDAYQPKQNEHYKWIQCYNIRLCWYWWQWSF